MPIGKLAMIIKNMDEYAAELATIERLLLSDPPWNARASLQRDHASILTSLKQRRDAAYQLDLYFAKSPNWVVLHDIHLAMGDSETEIDHLLISREMDVYVIDTSHYNSNIKLNGKGDFFRYNNGQPILIPSPVERNNHNIEFLANYLLHNGLLPSRFGFTIRPNFHNIALFSPTSVVELPKWQVPMEGELVKVKPFLERFTQSRIKGSGLQDFALMARQVTSETLTAMSQKLAQRHIPRGIDYTLRYGLERRGDKPVVVEAEDEFSCNCCDKRITARVVRYCYDNPDLFAGKAYCFDCQKGIAFQAVT